MGKDHAVPVRGESAESAESPQLSRHWPSSAHNARRHMCRPSVRSIDRRTQLNNPRQFWVFHPVGHGPYHGVRCDEPAFVQGCSRRRMIFGLAPQRPPSSRASDGGGARVLTSPVVVASACFFAQSGSGATSAGTELVAVLPASGLRPHAGTRRGGPDGSRPARRQDGASSAASPPGCGAPLLSPSGSAARLPCGRSRGLRPVPPRG
jgi:hypothetical protein